MELVPHHGVPADLAQAAAQLIASRRTANTRIAYATDWNRWCAFVARMRIDGRNPTLAWTVVFRDELIRQHASATVARTLGILSFMYRAFADAGLVKGNPFSQAWLPRPAPSAVARTPAIADEDAQRILVACAADTSAVGRRDLAILRLLYDTGLRRSSVAALRRDAVDLRGQAIRVIVKGGREERSVLTETCACALGAWLEVAPPSPFVFPAAGASNRHIHEVTINKIVTSRAKAAGVPHVHPHCFRAAFITAAYDAQVYERDIQAAAHHVDAATTRRYDRGKRGAHVVDVVARHRTKQRLRARTRRARGLA